MPVLAVYLLIFDFPSMECTEMAIGRAIVGLRKQGATAKLISPVRGRNQAGAAVSCLALVFGVGVLGAIGLFAFEVSRASLASQQLKVASDSAGLAYLLTYSDKGGAAHDADNESVKAIAGKVGKDIFEENSVLGGKLKDGLGHIDFKLQEGTGTKPASVTVESRCSVSPVFKDLLKLGNYQISCSSTVTFPKLDIVLCVETSDRMADWTPIKYIRKYRKWKDENDPQKGLKDGTDPWGPDWGYDVCPNGKMVLGKRGWKHTPGYPLPPQMLIANHDPGAYYPTVYFNPQLRNTGDPRQWDLPATFGDAAVGAETNLRGGKIKAGSVQEKQQYTDLVVDIPGWTDERLVNESRQSTSDKSEYEILARQQIQPLNICLDSLREFVDILHERYPEAHVGLVTFAGQDSKKFADKDKDEGSFSFQSVSTGSGDTAGGSVVGKGCGDVRTYNMPYSDLTSDSGVLKRKLCNGNDPTVQDPEGVSVYPGSAINHGLDAALNMLSKDNGRRKVVVLLTRGLSLGLYREDKEDKGPNAYKLKRWMNFPLVDQDFPISICGIHTARQMSCLDPCKRARQAGIPIYTIGFYGPREELGHYDAWHTDHFKDDPNYSLGSVDKDLGDQDPNNIPEEEKVRLSKLDPKNVSRGLHMAWQSGHGARYYRVAESDFVDGPKPTMTPGEYKAPDEDTFPNCPTREKIRERLRQVFQNIARNLVTL